MGCQGLVQGHTIRHVISCETKSNHSITVKSTFTPFGVLPFYWFYKSNLVNIIDQHITYKCGNSFDYIHIGLSPNWSRQMAARSVPGSASGFLP